MKVGFIVGKDDEIYSDDNLYDITPKKYLQYEELNTDVAIAMTIKQSYPDINVDIILPKDISLQRLKKNDVNFILGYDCINQIVGEPYVKKFTGKTNDKKRILQLISSSFKHNIGGKDDSINVIMYGGRLGNWR